MPPPQGGLPGPMLGGGPAHFSVAGNPVRITSQGVGATVTACVDAKKMSSALPWRSWQCDIACICNLTINVVSFASVCAHSLLKACLYAINNQRVLSSRA